MQKVIVVNLNGNAYQLDEPAYQSLRAYLDRATDKLASNPDKDEILADIEQAIADKCSRYLGAHKTVVLAAEVEQIVGEMGPIDGAAAEGEGPAQQHQAGPSDTPESGPSAPKRLYQIRDGAMISGVCNGIAAYFNLDPTIVRVVFVVLAFATAGLWVFVYLVLMFVIPFATTSEEHAAAHGLPFNTQELIEQAKKKYAEFRDSSQWKWRWKQQRRAWRQQRRAWKQHWRQDPGVSPAWPMDAPHQAGYATQLAAGLLAPVFIVLRVALFWVFACALISLLMTGAIFHLSLPGDLPLWAAILILVLFYQVIAWPLHAARRASYYALGYGYGHFAAADGLIGFGFAILFFWLAYHYIPEVHDFVRNLPTIWPSIWDNIRQSVK